MLWSSPSSASSLSTLLLLGIKEYPEFDSRGRESWPARRTVLRTIWTESLNETFGARHELCAPRTIFPPKFPQNNVYFSFSAYTQFSTSFSHSATERKNKEYFSEYSLFGIVRKRTLLYFICLYCFVNWSAVYAPEVHIICW